MLFLYSLVIRKYLKRNIRSSRALLYSIYIAFLITMPFLALRVLLCKSLLQSKLCNRVSSCFKLLEFLTTLIFKTLALILLNSLLSLLLRLCLLLLLVIKVLLLLLLTLLLLLFCLIRTLALFYSNKEYSINIL